MKPPEKNIACWEQLVSELQKLPQIDLACRGEERDFSGDMEARIDRCLDLRSNLRLRLRMETAVCQRFQEHAPIYLSDVEQRYLETRWLQLIVMQHYGVPTRLLDWTKSAWVAVFFAVFGAWESDGFVYGFRRDKLQQYLKQKFHSELNELTWGQDPTDKRPPDNKWEQAEANNILFNPEKTELLSDWVVTYYCRRAHFPRLVAQQGLFTFASKPYLDHWKTITNFLADVDDCFVLRIQAAAKPGILRHLNNIGLNGATLFPGADGIGKSLEGFVRAWHLEPQPWQLQQSI